jgi:hypothetical protein
MGSIENARSVSEGQVAARSCLVDANEYGAALGNGGGGGMFNGIGRGDPFSNFDRIFENQCNITVNVAGRAKKWDRPSFIGVAAEIVRSLTTQCDVAFKEIYEYRQMDPSRIGGMGKKVGGGGSGKKRKTSPLPLVNNAASAAAAAAAATTTATTTTATTTATTTTADSSNRPLGAFTFVVSEKSAMACVASFLDAFSVTSLGSTSRSFLHHGALTSDAVWEALYMKRFNTSKILPSDATKADRHKASKDSRYKFVLATKLNSCPDSDAIRGASLLSSRSALLSNHSSIHTRGVKAWAYLVNRSNGFTTRAVVQPGGGVKPLNVVEVRVVVQNTGLNGRLLMLNSAAGKVGVTVAGGGGFGVVESDPRLIKRVTDVGGRTLPQRQLREGGSVAVAALYESFVVCAYINVAGCTSEAEFYRVKGEIVLDAIWEGEESGGGGRQEGMVLRVPINEVGR